MTDDNQDNTGINYELLVEDSLRNVVRGALTIAEHAGLPGDAHFYITFKSTHPGAEVNPDLVTDDNCELTIVLQHQFWDLTVREDFFSVTLSFSGKPENLIVPFSAVTQFSDPSAGFGLQFGVIDDNEDGDQEDGEDDAKSNLVALEHDKPDDDTSAEIVSLDSFRNKPSSD